MEEEIIEENKNEKINKSKNKKFIIKYIILLIVLISITGTAIYFTIKYLDDKYKENSMESATENRKSDRNSEDDKYIIKSFNETYDVNSINLIDYYDINGNISNEKYGYINAKKVVHFIQIEGLKNKDIQENLNKRLKESAYSLKDNTDDSYVFTIITANFSNILSVHIYNHKYKYKTLNIDLTTGNDIPLEKVFVSTAPINSFLADGLYKTLAWQNLKYDEENEGANMDEVDTSEYEDKFIMLINKYNKQKENIVYNIYPASITIYELADENILGIDANEIASAINIDLTEYVDEVAIYKRYLTKESIFENDNLGYKDRIVFTDTIGYDDWLEELSYGKLSYNIFIEEILMKTGEEKDINDITRRYIQKLSDEQKQILRENTPSDKGTFLQRQYLVYEDNDGKYYVIDVFTFQAICSSSYFKEDGFKDYVKLKTRPRADIGMQGFSQYMKKDFPNLEILEEYSEDYYISKTGEFLGKTKEEADSKIEKEKEQELEQNIIEDEEDNTNINTNIQNEENIIENEIIIEENTIN